MSALLTRFDNICERLDRAIANSGRQKKELRLVAVSKLHGAAAVAELAAHWAGRGRPLFGESYMQEAKSKMAETASLLAGCDLPTCPDWHFVGHVQSKKAKDIAGRFSLIHSVDSIKLALLLHNSWQSRVAGAPVGLADPAPGPQGVLIQVNVGREPQKSGIAPEGLEELATAMLELPGLKLEGLMCLPPLAEIGERSRPYFVMLRKLRDSLERRLGARLSELSMGMSDDFEAAVAEGATLVRIGAEIFGPRDKP